MEKNLPGPVALFGSGETSPSGRKVFDLLLRKLPLAPRLALLETPAGFELNSARVIGRVAEFLEERLQNYHPRVQVVPARARGTPYSPDEPDAVSGLLEADLIFMGPGSPTYAVRQLRDSLAWQMLLARHRLGAALALASAATIALSTYALPVYEIYKVGEDLHWKPGLDFFGLYGLPLVFVPHWNNNDGGEELDTSRCFMGQARFARLMEMLPSGLTVLGIDEKTALILDIQSATAQVAGLGGVTLLQGGKSQSYTSGQSFPLNECCPLEVPGFSMGLSAELWQQAFAVQRRLQAQLEMGGGKPSLAVPPAVQDLVARRQAARERRDWPGSDALRDEIEALGWRVRDTPDGPVVEEMI